MIYRPKICGVCHGAQRAISLAQDLALSKKHVYIYKEILHNEKVISQLKEMGAETISSLDGLSCGDTLIIRAHGEGRDTYRYLDEKGIHYYDATCPNVVRIHEKISDCYHKGYSIVIIGKKNHPEVIGSNGWCDNSAYIVENEDDVKGLSSLHEQILVICQTTISPSMFEKLYSLIQERFPDREIECVNSICHMQKAIQESSVSLAKDMDYTFVIGGEKSSNTRELFCECSKVCSRSYLFSHLSSFLEFLKKEEGLTRQSKVCITGGASTPIAELDEYQRLLEFFLLYRDYRKYYEKKLVSINEFYFDSQDNSIVQDAVQKFIGMNQGGKYIRAFLIELGYLLKGTEEHYASILALAYETFQTSILVHDDIIDHSEVRRGMKTIPVLYQEDFKGKSSCAQFPEKTEELGNSLGICLGDLGFFLSNKLILHYYGNHPQLSRLLEYYHDVVIRTIKGEIMDVFLPFREEFVKSGVQLEEVLEISRLKTSWYTIVGPFCLGMILSCASSEEIEQMEKILLLLGVAFQIQDDLLGIYSDAAILGKDSSDISEFKQTLLYYYASKEDSYRERLFQYYGKENLSLKEVEEVRTIFLESGAKEFALSMMKKMFQEAKDGIEKLDIPSYYRDVLLGFISYLELREK